jgi:hypothetical protein
MFSENRFTQPVHLSFLKGMLSGNGEVRIFGKALDTEITHRLSSFAVGFEPVTLDLLMNDYGDLHTFEFKKIPQMPDNRCFSPVMANVIAVLDKPTVDPLILDRNRNNRRSCFQGGIKKGRKKRKNLGPIRRMAFGKIKNINILP